MEKQVGGGHSAGRGSKGYFQEVHSDGDESDRPGCGGEWCLGEGSCEMGGESLSVEGQDPSERRMVGEGQEREVIPGRVGTKEGVSAAQRSQREVGFHPR